MSACVRFVTTCVNWIWYRMVLLGSLTWFFVFCRGRIRGVEHLRSALESGCVLVANHVSYLDWMVLHAYLFHRHGSKLPFLAKSKLFQHRLWGPLMLCSKAVRVSESGALHGTSAFRRLKNSHLIGVFPEGTRSRTGLPGQTKSGAVRIARSLHKPILPVALHGFFEAWPSHHRFPRPARCVIEFFPLVPVQAVTKIDDQAAQDLTTCIMGRIAAAVASRRNDGCKSS